jgi:predicted amidohydrolase
MRIRIAQIKVYPNKGVLKVNHRRLMSILEAVAEYGPDVVVTPECFLDGYVATEDSVTRGDLSSYGIDPVDSPYTREISGWASRSRSWVILGCTRLDLEGAYNSALVFDREGQLVGTYDKIHCQTQDKKFIPGNRLPVFQSDFGLFGVMICADRRWAETVRTLALKGARVIFNPTYGMHDERNLRMMQTRSYESEVFIVFTHPGQSLVTGPTGEVVCNQEAEETTFTICEIDLAQADRVRSGESSHLRDRRPDVYEL